MSIWENVLFLFLGWLLGLLSPIVVSQIERWRDKRVIRLGLRTELSELRFKLMGVAHLIATRTGTADREFLRWVQPIAKQYEGVHPKDNILQGIEKLLALPDEQLAALNAHEKATKRGVALGMKKYQLPFLESQVNSLGLFDLTFQRVVLEIRAQLTSFIEDIDQTRFYFEKTYDSSISEENHKSVNQNLDDLYATMGRRARQIVDLIGKLPPA